MNENEDFMFLFILKFHQFDFDMCLKRSKLTEEEFSKKVGDMFNKGFLKNTKEDKKLPYDLSDAGILEMLGNQTGSRFQNSSTRVKYILIILALAAIAILAFLLKS